MELVKVYIKNFRSIKEEVFVKINNTITTVIGLNESGKSTLLKAIEKLNGIKINEKEKNKDRQYKKEYSYVKGRFLLTSQEVKQINNLSCFKVIKFPENDLYIDVCIDDTDEVRYEVGLKIEKDYQHLEMFEFLKVTLDNEIKNIFNKNKLSADKIISDICTAQSLSDLEQMYLQSIEEYHNQNIYEELVELSKELKPNLWYSLIPKFKIILFNSSDILRDEINISEIKQNIQVANLLKIAGIDIDEFITNFEKNENEELKTYEGIYESKVTKTFAKIFRQNDTDFKFGIQFDNKNGKILFYTYDKTSGASPIPLKNRSDGFKWYFSIYLTLYEYLQRKDSTKYILLFDEPNLYLNPSAQKDLVERVFKNEFSKEQIVYTTHSPYMIDTTNFSSIRIVDKIDSSHFYNTTTEYFKAHKPIKNEVDPMTPILTALNIDVCNNLILDKKQKIIVVEGIYDSYILNALLKKTKYDNKLKNVNFIPCLGASKIPLMFGYLYGMGYDVYVLTDNDKDGLNAIYEIIGYEKENSVLFNKLHTYNKKIDKESVFVLENLFSKSDLNKYLTPKNSVLYRDFCINISATELEKETIDNFKKLYDYIYKFIGGTNG